jgi:hypothetical protein
MNALLSRLPGRVAGAAVGAVVAGLVLSDSKAHALIVNVGGQDYEVSTFTGSYIENSSKFETAANGGVMPWWEKSSSTVEFASAVYTNLGSSYSAWVANLGVTSVSFAYRCAPLSCRSLTSPFTLLAYGVGGGFGLGGGVLVYGTGDTSPKTWAQATLVPAALVPAPFPVVGALAALSSCRRLRATSRRLRER